MFLIEFVNFIVDLFFKFVEVFLFCLDGRSWRVVIAEVKEFGVFLFILLDI